MSAPAPAAAAPAAPAAPAPGHGTSQRRLYRYVYLPEDFTCDDEPEKIESPAPKRLHSNSSGSAARKRRRASRKVEDEDPEPVEDHSIVLLQSPQPAPAQEPAAAAAAAPAVAAGASGERGCCLDSLPDAILSRVFVFVASAIDPELEQQQRQPWLQNPAPPLCCGALEAELCPELALDPDAMPEKLGPLRGVCRRFKRLVDEDAACWQRVLLDCSGQRGALSAQDDLSPRIDGEPSSSSSSSASDSSSSYSDSDGEFGGSSPAPARLVAPLLRQREVVKRGVRRLRVCFGGSPDLCSVQLAALCGDDALAAGVEELDLLFLRSPSQFHPGACLSALSGFPNLRRLRVASCEVFADLDGALQVSGPGRAPFRIRTFRRRRSVDKLLRGLCSGGLPEPLASAAAAIASLRKLEVLDAPALPATAAAVQVLAGLPLRALRLAAPDLLLDDDASAVLSHAAAAAAARAFPRLERLHVRCARPLRWFASPDAEDAEAEQALLDPLSALTQLRSLSLEQPLSSLAFLRPLTRLEHLSALVPWEADPAPLAALGPRLRSLGLAHHGFPRDSEIFRPPGETSFWRLEVDAALASMQALEGLHLHADEQTLLALAAAPLALPRLRALKIFSSDSGQAPPGVVTWAAAAPGLRDLCIDSLLLPPSDEVAAALADSRLWRIRTVPTKELNYFYPDAGRLTRDDLLWWHRLLSVMTREFEARVGVRVERAGLPPPPIDRDLHRERGTITPIDSTKKRRAFFEQL
eukprot:tig00020572_g11559.t1